MTKVRIYKESKSTKGREYGDGL